jgi:hypothetical protein
MGVFSSREGEEVSDVQLERQRLKISRTLIAAPIVGHDVKGVDASSESSEGATTVESAVNADERGLGHVDAPFGDRQSRDR